jgi:hypothetical protein
MRTFLWSVFAILIMSTQSSDAQIGETFQQCEARYGSVVRLQTDGLKWFHKGGFLIAIHFYEGRADRIWYAKGTSNTAEVYNELSDSEIQSLLKRNSDDRQWIADDPMLPGKSWHLQDNSIYAQYTRSHNYLFVLTADSRNRLYEENRIDRVARTTAPSDQTSLTSSGLAQIYETREACAASLGEPVTIGGLVVSGKNGALFEKAGFRMGIDFYEDLVDEITYWRVGADKDNDHLPLSEDDIQLLLRTSAPGHTWTGPVRKSDGRRYWKSEDQTLGANYTDDSRSMLHIYTKDYLSR